MTMFLQLLLQRTLSHHRFLIATALAILLISACSSAPKVNFSQANEQELYETSQEYIRKGFYELAIQALETIEKRYPFGEYSKSAQLSLIYAHYAFNEPELATSVANRFIRLHPQNRHVDYAHYMKGLIAFPEADSILQKAFNIDISKRDISQANESFNYFSDLVRQFPNSEYTPDALQRMTFLRNLLARHEIHVANYYIERKAYLAAVNRGQYVLENFQQTPAIPDALAIMAQGYHLMGLKDLTNNSIKTLRTNYPDYPAFNNDGEFDFNYSSENGQSWFNVATLGLLKGSRPPGFNTEELYNRPQN